MIVIIYLLLVSILSSKSFRNRWLYIDRNTVIMLENIIKTLKKDGW